VDVPIHPQGVLARWPREPFSIGLPKLKIGSTVGTVDHVDALDSGECSNVAGEFETAAWQSNVSSSAIRAILGAKINFLGPILEVPPQLTAC